ncbi:LacI family DNA-binding transcriptional regulator [Altericroceibacterium spongiae]|uniref:LacI family DNA-binding transcriptional regulator n=1 Tax=Altericroceibacterium spongiae TaxID=2320269 RepID=A0A420EA67_9SPHN|nr:LacI family DNA-binding transcriptional regulator [Altericroceibacterium spongiae]RKF17574.1 LacI family DNA-binding transcriptional regulator [Altericroceibacterium spongiae]
MARTRRNFSNRVTLSTVAERAGVSPMTVSNVLNEKPNVTPAKREAVMEAVRELGYQPNRAARALASASALRIGLLHRDTESSFLGQVLLGTLRAANRHGTEIAVRPFDPADEKSALKAAEGLIRSGIDGLIVPPPLCENPSIMELQARYHIPMIALAPGASLETIPSVRIDDEAAAYDLTRLLLARGHRRIGFIRFASSHLVSASREAGHRRALQEAGIPDDPALIWTGRPTYEDGLKAAEYFLSLAEPPSAIFGSSDDLAAAIVNYAHRQGMRIPEDLSVAGFDDAPIASQIWPQLTTVRQSISNIAEIATEYLLKSLSERSEMAPEAQLVDYEVIERQSVANLLEPAKV